MFTAPINPSSLNSWKPTSARLDPRVKSSRNIWWASDSLMEKRSLCIVDAWIHNGIVFAKKKKTPVLHDSIGHRAWKVEATWWTSINKKTWHDSTNEPNWPSNPRFLSTRQDFLHKMMNAWQASSFGPLMRGYRSIQRRSILCICVHWPDYPRCIDVD